MIWRLVGGWMFQRGPRCITWSWKGGQDQEGAGCSRGGQGVLLGVGREARIRRGECGGGNPSVLVPGVFCCFFCVCGGCNGSCS